VEVGASGVPEEVARRLAEGARSHERRAEIDRFVVAGETEAAELVREVLASGGHLLELVPHRGTLEDLLLRVAARKAAPPA
jgi:hypothetical protein